MGPTPTIRTVCATLVFCITFISSICSGRADQSGDCRRQIKLAVQPQCGTFSSSKFVNFNTGIKLRQIETIYSFGDSWTSNGVSDGSAAKPPVRKGTDPMAGGRASNGLMWTEYLAHQRHLKNYGMGGATIDHTLWETGAKNTDMVQHVDTMIKQKPAIDSDSSLALIFYGINDDAAFQSGRGPGTLQQAAKQLIKQTERLIDVGLKKFVVLSPPFSQSEVDQFDNVIWKGLKQLKESKGIEFAYVDIATLFAAITDNPSSFGYTSVESCLKSFTTTVGGCTNPNHYLVSAPCCRSCH